MNNTDTVTIDEVEYLVDDLSDEVRHVLSQIQYTRDQSHTAQLEQQRADMMQRGYIAELAEAMKRMNNEAAND
jgi:Mg2+ and Co2+ transporter CorA